MKRSEIKQLSTQKWVPILREKSADFLCNLIKQSQPKTILEIGTCLGYSGTLMLSIAPYAHLTTVEIDTDSFMQAQKTFADEGVLDRATLINDDAMNVITNLARQQKKFDLIFLDGPKGQYFKYLPYLKSMLNLGGYLVADDVLFHGYVKQENVGHKHRTIVNSLKNYLADLDADPSFSHELIEMEDGLSVAQKNI